MNRFLKYASGTSGAALFLALASTNWYVHEPRYWQQARAQKLPAPLARWIPLVGNMTADTTDALGLTGHDVSAPLAAALPTNRLVCAGLPRRLPDSPAPDDILVLNKTGFVIGYSPSLRHPVWVAYKTYPVRHSTLPARAARFQPDPVAPKSPQSKEYANSGYNRGHMAPNLAIATRYGKVSQAQTFLTSNICPQRPSLNQGTWYDVEFRIAELWPDCCGEVWVITGALSPRDGKRTATGVDIPAAFYQIVVSQQKGTLRAFAVYMPQNLRRRTPPRTTLVSIDELEALAGFDFLADLPDDCEQKLEAATPSRLWPAGLRGTFKLLRELYRSYN
ncbi:MAG: DNA/RNA non-specific endonuclease [bacterium]